ncbi:MAG: hypothetical protein JNK82_35125 [Myxococcaceae bacterium]|nr:hypothetical protein [Myxococcaceae bacterium]
MTSDALLAEPPGSAAFQVWGDALLERGDPRGELVQLSRSRPSAEVRAALQALTAKHPEWTKGCEQHFRVEFKDGFIDALVMPEGHAAQQLERGDGYCDEPELPVLYDGVTARLRRFSADTMLSVVPDHGCWGRQSKTFDALVSMERPWLRTVEVDRRLMSEPLDEASGRARLSHALKGSMHEAEVHLGHSLARLWHAAPRLEHLVIAQAQELDLGNVDAPHLRTLCLGLMPVGAAQLGALAEARVPQLKWLELRLQREAWRKDELDGAALSELLESGAVARLEHLGLLGTGAGQPYGDVVLDVLGRWERLSSLRSLDLGGLSCSPQAWRRFVELKPRLKWLRLCRSTVRDPEWLQAVLPVEWRRAEGD